MDLALESVAPVAAIQQSAMALPAVPDASVQGAGGADVFASLMHGVGEVSDDVNAAESAMQGVAAGKSVAMHEAMISLERANISVQVFMQVRNKLVESYQDLMRMQM